MNIVLSVDVYCRKFRDGKTIYRVYVDNDLLTERNWIWPVNVYVRENIEVDVEPGIHRIRVVEPNTGSPDIYVKNLMVAEPATIGSQDLHFELKS